MMDRETKSNDELREIFQNRIDSRTEIDGDHVNISILGMSLTRTDVIGARDFMVITVGLTPY